MPTIVDILKYTLQLDDSQFTAQAAKADVQANQLADSIGGSLTDAVGMLATAFGALKIAEFLKDTALTAARTEVLGTALAVVGKNAGVSQGELALLEEQVKALGITTQEARSSIIKFIQSGLPLEKLAQLARLAQDSAVNAGINSSEAFERLARGIQTGQIELLRSAGVFVSIESELNKFARTSGKAREGLTDLERQTVILNAVLAQGSKLAGSYEAAMGDVGKQMTSLPRFFEEFQNALGKFFLPTMEAAVGTTTDLLKAITNLLTSDVITSATKALAGQQSTVSTQAQINALTKEREEIVAKIAKDEKLVNEAISARGILMTSGLSLVANIGFFTNLERYKSELKDIDRLLDGFKVKQAEGLLSPHRVKAAQEAAEAERLALEAEERAKRAAERDKKRGAELAKTITIGGDLSGSFESEWQKFLKTIDAIPLEAEFDIAKIRKQISAARNEFVLGVVTDANRPQQDSIFDIGAIQQQLSERRKQREQEADEIRGQLGQAFYDVGNVASSVFQSIFGEANQAFDSILAAISQFSTGNITGGVVTAIGGLFDAVASVFGLAQDSTEKLIHSQVDMTRAIRDWLGGLREMTQNDLQSQIAGAQWLRDFIMRTPNADPAWIQEQADRIGIPINLFGDVVGQLNDAIDQMTGQIDRWTKGLEADTPTERAGIVSGSSTIDEAFQWIDFFSQQFDLSLEEQRKLWQDVLDQWAKSGNLSQADREFIMGRIEELNTGKVSNEPTQTERSIARVTERQADTLISAISTMDLHLREGFESVVDSIQSLAVNALGTLQGNAGGGTTITIGALTLEGQDATAVENILVKKLNTGARAAGIPRIA